MNYQALLENPASAFELREVGDYEAPALTMEAMAIIGEEASIWAAEQEGPNSINYGSLCEYRELQLIQELCDRFAEGYINE